MGHDPHCKASKMGHDPGVSGVSSCDVDPVELADVVQLIQAVSGASSCGGGSSRDEAIGYKSSARTSIDPVELADVVIHSHVGSL
jgi:hypothetical protein